MKYYFLKSAGVVAPIDRAVLRFRTADRVELILSSTQSFVGVVADLEVLDEAQVADIITAIKSGLDFR